MRVRFSYAFRATFEPSPLILCVKRERRRYVNLIAPPLVLGLASTSTKRRFIRSPVTLMCDNVTLEITEISHCLFDMRIN